MNDALDQADAGIRLEFDYQARGKKAGDLRNNMLVLIDDPLANGLLGYAPTVTNPYTGEIIQGHVNMYGGVLTSTSRYVWQSMVDLTVNRALKSANDEKSVEKNIPGLSLIELSKLQERAPKVKEQIHNFKNFVKDHKHLAELKSSEFTIFCQS